MALATLLPRGRGKFAESLRLSFNIEWVSTAAKAMNAMVISTAGRGLETRDACLREDLVLHVGFALLDEQRAGLFKEIDKQLAILSGTAPVARQAPRAIERAVPPPRAIPAITLRRKLEAPAARAPRLIFRARLAAVASVIVGTFALGWFAAASLDAWLNGPLTGSAAVEAVVEHIINAESNDNADAKNKRSSATGPAQFLDQTWLEMIRAYRSDLAKGRSREQMLALRRDAKITREMTRRFAERHAAMMARRGLPVTPATVYLAHFAGGAGAVAILSAQLEADAAQVMAYADATGRTKREQIVKANPFLDKFSVADLELWADRKMQGVDLRLTELMPASRKK